MNAENRHLKLKCMYTKHLVKKRKSWNDGFLKVSWTGNSAVCSLVDANEGRQIILESRVLELSELALINKGDEFTLDLENYLVQIEMQLKNIQTTSQQPILKLPKFVTPTSVARKVTPLQSSQLQGQQLSAPTLSTCPVFTSGVYKVSTDELDDIWGNPQSQSTKYNTNMPIHSRNSSDTFNDHQQHKVQRTTSSGIHNSSGLKLSEVDRAGSVYENRYKPSKRVELSSVASSENWSNNRSGHERQQTQVTSSSGAVSRHPTNISESSEQRDSFSNDSPRKFSNTNMWQQSSEPPEDEGSLENRGIHAESDSSNWPHQHGPSQFISATPQFAAPVSSVDASIWDDF
jgi:hypothetical protein